MFFFFFNDTATTEIYTLSLHDALPIFIGLEQGKKQRQAVLDAGISRLRPILMTSLSTIAGTFPLALGLGAGAEVRQSMGVAVIGGFSTSTLLTLVVVPVLFTYIDNFQYWLINLVKYGFKKKPSRKIIEEDKKVRS